MRMYLTNGSTQGATTREHTYTITIRFHPIIVEREREREREASGMQAMHDFPSTGAVGQGIEPVPCAAAGKG